MPKVYNALESVTRYTHFVLLGKRALWLFALALLAALVAVVWINMGDEGGRITFSGAVPKGSRADEHDAMVRPRYQGVDSRNRPFTITADRAVQQDANTVLLEAVKADMTLEDSAWLALEARQGTYDIPTRHLTLRGDIHLFYEGGYEFRSEEARIDIPAGTAAGSQPVEGQGPSGILKADSFTVLDRGAVLRFNGHVHVTLYL